MLVKKEPFYMLSNTDNLYGAAVLVDKQLLSQVGRKLEEEFYILPASMSDLIIVSKLEGFFVYKNFRFILLTFFSNGVIISHCK